MMTFSICGMKSPKQPPVRAPMRKVETPHSPSSAKKSCPPPEMCIRDRLQVGLGKRRFTQDGHQLLVFLTGGVGGKKLVHRAEMCIRDSRDPGTVRFR